MVLLFFAITTTLFNFDFLRKNINHPYYKNVDISKPEPQVQGRVNLIRFPDQDSSIDMYSKYYHSSMHISFNEKEHFKNLFKVYQTTINAYQNIIDKILHLQDIKYSSNEDSQMVSIIKEIIYLEKMYSYAPPSIRGKLFSTLTDSLHRHLKESKNKAINKIHEQNLLELFEPLAKHSPEDSYNFLQKINFDSSPINHQITVSLNKYFLFIQMVTGNLSYVEARAQWPNLYGVTSS